MIDDNFDHGTLSLEVLVHFETIQIIGISKKNNGSQRNFTL
jgi:hypothetical protein